MNTSRRRIINCVDEVLGLEIISSNKLYLLSNDTLNEAISYGITVEEDIGFYIILKFWGSRDMTWPREILTILRSNSISSSRKLRDVYQYILNSLDGDLRVAKG